MPDLIVETAGHVRVLRPSWPPRRALRDLLGGGFSYALVGLDALLVLVLFTTERGAGGKTGLFTLFFLLSPTVRAGMEWAQLLYFDLKRLEIRVFRNLKRRFERAALRLAVVLGVLFAGIGALTSPGSAGSSSRSSSRRRCSRSSRWRPTRTAPTGR